MDTAKKLNITMVCDPIGSNKSGVVVSTRRFAKLLTERGHHVIFVGAKSAEHADHSTHDDIKAYRYRSIPIPKSGGWNLSFPTVGELKKVFQDEKIDVVHIILPMSGAIMAVKAARSLGIKIVAHSHSQPENLFVGMPRFMRPLLYSIWNRYLAWMYNKAEVLMYPSELARALLSKLSRPGQRSVVISNGIDTSEFKPLPVGDFYSRFHIPENAIKLLFVGRLFPEKSIDTLIEAIPRILEKYPETHLMIVGGGHLRASLESLTQTLGISKQVTFLGLASDHDKLLSYNACDIFVLPSLAELEGMVVLEAMACAKPIVISDAEMSASRYFVDGNGFLFKAQDPLDLSEKILKLVMDGELRRQMGERSLLKSRDYDIHKSVDKLEEVYYSTQQ